MKEKSNKGITLVALIITIIVLLILAVVAITSIRNSNIIKYAQNGRDMYNHGKEDEEIKLNEYEKYIEDKVIKPISQTESYVGYYADIDKDGTVDGIIYADLAHSVSGQWLDSRGTFSYEAIKKGTKEYYISNTSHEGEFGTKDVINVVPGSTGADRFYVMALEDVTGTKKDGTTTTSNFCWYDAAYKKISDYSKVTSTSFGAGRENTLTMISKWNEPAYGNKDDNETYKDMWGVIQNKAEEGWFVPSKEELSAFAKNLGMTYGNYHAWDGKMLWSSSLSDSYNAYRATFGYLGVMGTNVIWGGGGIRLSATF